MASIRCENCGAPKKREDEGECPYCGTHYTYKEKENCSAQSSGQEDTRSHTYSRKYEESAAASYDITKHLSRRVIAAILAIVLGVFGAQHFYLKKYVWGVLSLVFFFTGVTAIIGLIQGVLWLLATDADFESRYPE